MAVGGATLGGVFLALECLMRTLYYQGGYSGFQVTGMIEGFFWVLNFRFQDFFGYENLASIFLGSLISVGIFWGY